MNFKNLRKIDRYKNKRTHEFQSEFTWKTAEPTCAHKYLLPTIFSILKHTEANKIFDLGCGNGSVDYLLHQQGYQVIGVDPSITGVQLAKKAYPKLKFYLGSAYDNLQKKFGQFPVVMSLEVVEHCFLPKVYAKTIFNLLEPGGKAILSTPFHGYWKNFIIALTGNFDRHVDPLWDYGHIKFWSVKTISRLLMESGFESDI